MDRLLAAIGRQKRVAADPVEVICEPDVKWEHLARIYNVFFGAGLTNITFRMADPAKRPQVLDDAAAHGSAALGRHIRIGSRTGRHRPRGRCMAEGARRTINEFLESQTGSRLAAEWAGGLPLTLRERLFESAEDAAKRLRHTADRQHDLKLQIEEYQGPDWDLKYGVTDLWRRKLGQDILNTTLNLCLTEFSTKHWSPIMNKGA